MKSLRAAHTDGDEQNANDSQRPADDFTTSDTAVSLKTIDSESHLSHFTVKHHFQECHNITSLLHRAEPSPPEQHWQWHHHQLESSCNRWNHHHHHQHHQRLHNRVHCLTRRSSPGSPLQNIGRLKRRWVRSIEEEINWASMQHSVALNRRESDSPPKCHQAHQTTAWINNAH